jgi:hypothetical protein
LDFSDIEDAFWNLAEINSNSWIQVVKEMDPKLKQPFPLLQAIAYNISACVKLPDFGKTTIEKFIHSIDSSMHPEKVYSDLVPLELTIAAEELTIHLRDYELPLIYIPKSQLQGVASFKASGYIIVAEMIGGPESNRIVKIPLTPLPTPPLLVTRNINPVKVFTKTSTVISTQSSVLMNWG